MTDFGSGAEHDGGRAILPGAEADGPLYLLLLEIAPGDDEVGVDAGEYLGVLGSTLGLQLDDACGHLLPCLAQDQQDVELGAPPHAEEQQLHGPDPEITAAEFRGAVHDQGVSAAGLA